MSYRIIHQLFKNGRYVLESIYKRKYNTKILDVVQKPKEPFLVKVNDRRSLQQSLTHYDGLRNVGCQIGFHARKIFVDNVLNRVTNSLSSDLRRKATKRLFYGDSGPFFALVGVSLASGSGLLTKDDELEGVCWEIREAVSKLRLNYADPCEIPTEEVNLSDLIIGPPIAKGCSAVVYSAKYKNTTTSSVENHDDLSSVSIISEPENDIDLMTLNPFNDMRIMRQRHDSFRNSVPNMSFNTVQRNSENVGREHVVVDDNETNEQEEASRDRTDSFSIVSSCEMKSARSSETSMLAVDEMGSLSDYPIALKMMFNYDIQSCAAAIFKAMQRETLPARRKCRELESGSTLSALPPHPNIVLMHSVFADQIPRLPHDLSLFPSALPQRINSDGYGRNMSLFLLMKRYDCSLLEYLRSSKPTVRTSIILLAQLLEAIAHLSAHGIAHRDLKSDNILLELSDDDKTPPSLVLSDFGCCLADPQRGFLLPYNTNEIDKGGNVALMAPEVITQTPGSFSVINYSKADLWSVGTIAYELFGERNPFYGKTNDTLRNTTYNDTDLPTLPASVPNLVRCLVGNILQRSPSKRLSPSSAATVMQLFLWAPSNWIKDSIIPSSTEILQWLLCLTTKILCEARLSSNVENKTPLRPNTSEFNSTTNSQTTMTGVGRRTLPEYVLISSFLSRAKLHEIKRSLEWIHDL